MNFLVQLPIHCIVIQGHLRLVKFLTVKIVGGTYILECTHLLFSNIWSSVADSEHFDTDPELISLHFVRIKVRYRVPRYLPNNLPTSHLSLMLILKGTGTRDLIWLKVVSLE